MLGDAKLEILCERIDSRCRHIRVRGKIGLRVEESRGIAPLLPAEPIVVSEGIGTSGGHVRIRGEIAGGRIQRVGIAPFAPAELGVMLTRIHLRLSDIAVHGEAEQVIHEGRA